jgi:hypothetical protein
MTDSASAPAPNPNQDPNNTWSGKYNELDGSTWDLTSGSFSSGAGRPFIPPPSERLKAQSTHEPRHFKGAALVTIGSMVFLAVLTLVFANDGKEEIPPEFLRSVPRPAQHIYRESIFLEGNTPGSIAREEILELFTIDRTVNDYPSEWNIPLSASSMVTSLVALGLNGDEGLEIKSIDGSSQAVWWYADTKQKRRVDHYNREGIYVRTVYYNPDGSMMEQDLSTE